MAAAILAPQFPTGNPNACRDSAPPAPWLAASLAAIMPIHSRSHMRPNCITGTSAPQQLPLRRFPHIDVLQSKHRCFSPLAPSASYRRQIRFTCRLVQTQNSSRIHQPQLSTRHAGQHSHPPPLALAHPCPSQPKSPQEIFSLGHFLTRSFWGHYQEWRDKHSNFALLQEKHPLCRLFKGLIICNLGCGSDFQPQSGPPVSRGA